MTGSPLSIQLMRCIVGEQWYEVSEWWRGHEVLLNVKKEQINYGEVEELQYLHHLFAESNALWESKVHWV